MTGIEGLTRTIGRLVHLGLKPAILGGIGLVGMVVTRRCRPLCRQLADPAGLAVGLALGLGVYYGTAAWIFKQAWPMRSYLRAVSDALCVSRPPPRRIAVLAGRALYEEAVWRGTVQMALGNRAPGIVATALLFTLRHVYLYNRNRWRLGARPLVEFFGFSLFLGLLYRFSNRLMLVSSVHLARNILITTRCLFPE